MFRTAARSFAVSALRRPESVSQFEAAHQTAIDISKAQGVGQRGFIDGMVSKLTTNSSSTHTKHAIKQSAKLRSSASKDSLKKPAVTS